MQQCSTNALLVAPVILNAAIIVPIYAQYAQKGGKEDAALESHYRDALHNTPIEIINTEEDYRTEPLSFTLDNITFCSSSLSGFHLKDEEQWEEASKKFSLLKWGGCAVSPYLYDLQGFALEVEIPVTVFRKRDEQLIPGVLFLSFQYTKPDMSKPHSIIMSM